MDNNSFLDWWDVVREIHGFAPDPDDPLHFYDYRSAFKSGHGIPEKGDHWNSKFKHDFHPNRFVRGSDESVNKPDVEWWDTKYDKPATSKDVLKFDKLRDDYKQSLDNNSF